MRPSVRPSLNFKPAIRPVVDLAKKVCPNPNVSVTALPPKITFGCR